MLLSFYTAGPSTDITKLLSVSPLALCTDENSIALLLNEDVIQSLMVYM